MPVHIRLDTPSVRHIIIYSQRWYCFRISIFDSDASPAGFHYSIIVGTAILLHSPARTFSIQPMRPLRRKTKNSIRFEEDHSMQFVVSDLLRKGISSSLQGCSSGLYSFRSECLAGIAWPFFLHFTATSWYIRASCTILVMGIQKGGEERERHSPVSSKTWCKYWKTIKIPSGSVFVVVVTKRRGSDVMLKMLKFNCLRQTMAHQNW